MGPEPSYAPPPSHGHWKIHGKIHVNIFHKWWVSISFNLKTIDHFQTTPLPLFFFWGYQQNMALIIEIEWECSQGTWGNSEILMDSSHIWLKTFSWLNMIERKKPGYSNPIFSCWRFFRKSWWISHSEWSEKPHYSRGLARLCSNEIQGSSFFFSKTLRLRIMTILWPYYDHILEF